MNTNWKGQTRHAIDDYAWFKTDDEDRERMINLYNHVISNNETGREKALLKLIDMIRREVYNEAEFEFNGRDD